MPQRKTVFPIGEHLRIEPSQLVFEYPKHTRVSEMEKIVNELMTFTSKIFAKEGNEIASNAMKHFKKRLTNAFLDIDREIIVNSEVPSTQC